LLNKLLIVGVDNFSGSYGWLQRYKKRFDFRFLKIMREKFSSAPELVDPFRELFEAKKQQFC
jgi:hypothetical protein